MTSFTVKPQKIFPNQVVPKVANNIPKNTNNPWIPHITMLLHVTMDISSNKKIIRLLNLLINCKLTISKPYMFLLKDGHNLPFRKFLMIGLCNSLAKLFIRFSNFIFCFYFSKYSSAISSRFPIKSCLFFE